MNGTMKGSVHKTITWIFFLTFLLAVVSSIYHFLYKKNYDFLVETTCDPTSQQCFFRDCESSPDDCPPNNFSYYKEYTVKAFDYSHCADGTCATECEQGIIQCEAIPCDESAGDTCTTPEENNSGV